MLQTANVIAPVGIESEKIWYPHRVKSVRPDAKSRWVNVYRLTSRQLAEEFLKRCEAAPKTQPQPEPVNP